ncbi:hypothetical protein [Arsukibacterium indicum]|uniref:Uncharacterized protein n=1 Tax=Arsukibacterium indicum TaxID=2848612 RepID=A0ABS6MHC9_9GAMM|nr:hypothetical protein [Arsukibacterium indicum]MBV2128189.1 hypothetical protein [Arsukibacterium indicum]
MNLAFNSNHTTPFDMDDVIYTFVEPKHVREKVQREFKMIMRLRMAVYLSVLTSSDDEILDDARVRLRLDELLELLRKKIPSMTFVSGYIIKAGQLIPGVYLKVNHSATDAVLYREQADNVVYMEASA